MLGVEDVAELFFGEAVELGIVGVELGTENGAAVFVPLERWERDPLAWIGLGLGVGFDPVEKILGITTALHSDLPVRSVNELYHTRTSFCSFYLFHQRLKKRIPSIYVELNVQSRRHVIGQIHQLSPG